MLHCKFWFVYCHRFVFNNSQPKKVEGEKYWIYVYVRIQITQALQSIC
jgi:hypothetical protein